MSLLSPAYYFAASLIFLGATRGPRITFSRLCFALAVAIFWPIALPAIGLYAVGKSVFGSFPRF